MRCLIVSDIHGNLPALEAVLASPEAAACDRVISLGDQVNYCPESRAVMKRLEGLGAVMLLGNHEERLGHMQDFEGFNWALLHWTKAQVADLSLELPVDYRLGPCLFTHGMPGQSYCLVQPKELPARLEELPPDVTHLFSGHHHIVWHAEHQGRAAVNPGSVGVCEDGLPCRASFAVLDMTGDRPEVTLHAACYNADDVARAFITTGAATAAPQMCRIVMQTLRTGRYDTVGGTIRQILAVARPMGLTLADEEAWHAADSRITWMEPLSTAHYWQRLEENLL